MLLQNDKNKTFHLENVQLAHFAFFRPFLSVFVFQLKLLAKFKFLLQVASDNPKLTFFKYYLPKKDQLYLKSV